MADPSKKARRNPPPPLTDDLTEAILARLPAKSAGRFRCASKPFLSLTSDPQFPLSHFSHSADSGFFLRNPLKPPLYLPSDPLRPSSLLPDPSLSFLGQPVVLAFSCNGLVLALRNRRIREPIVLYVCNPVTRSFTTIPGTRLAGDHCSFSIAFDPSVSPYFKVVCFGASIVCGRRQIFIYSSETGFWKGLDPDLLGPFPDIFSEQRPAFWNGLLVWLGFEKSLVYLDVEKEKLGRLPLPHYFLDVEKEKLGRLPLPHYFRMCRYFGASAGRLHFIATPEGAGMETQFDILEMEPGCSQWSVLHRVDLDAIRDVYPEVVPTPKKPLKRRKTASRDPKQQLEFSTVHFLRGVGGEGDCLFLIVPEKIVSYHLKDKRFTMICDNLPTKGMLCVYDTRVYNWSRVFPLVHSLFSIIDNQKSTIANKKKGAIIDMDQVSWTIEHDKVLISLMIEHTLDGQKWGTSFRKGAWLDMVERFNANTKLNYHVDDLKNRLKLYRHEYQIVSNIKSHTSFNWDDKLQSVIAGDAEWNQYVAVNPEAKSYRREIAFFKEWEIICAPTAAKRQAPSSSKINNDETNASHNIPEVIGS